MRMETEHPELKEAFYVKSFIDGLKPEIRSAVRSHGPQELYTTIK